MRNLLDRLGSVSALHSAARRLHRSVGLLLLLLYGYFLQPAEFAVLVLLFLTTTLVETLAAQGLNPQAVGRLGVEQPDKTQQRAVLGPAFLQNLLAAALFFVALALLARPLAQLLFASAEPAKLLQLMAAAGFLRSLQNLPRQLLQVRRRLRHLAILRLGEALLTAALNIYLLAFAGLGLQGVVFGELVREVLVTLSLAVTLRHGVCLKLAGTPFRSLWHVGMPRLRRDFPALLLASNDRYVLALFTSLPLLGVYAFAWRIAQSLVDLAVQPLLHLLPFLNREFEASPAEKPRILGRFVTYFVALSGLLALAITVFAEPAMRLLAPAFEPASAVLPLLLLALLFAGLQRLLLSILALEGGLPERWPLILGAVAVSSLAGNLLLIPRLGTWGAALTAVLAQALLCAAALVLQRRRVGLPFETGRLAKVTAALCSTFYISRFVTPEPLLGQAAAAAAMVFLYPALLGVFGFYTVAEIDRMRDVLNRRVVLLPERSAAAPTAETHIPTRSTTAPELIGATADPVGRHTPS